MRKTVSHVFYRETTVNPNNSRDIRLTSGGILQVRVGPGDTLASLDAASRSYRVHGDVHLAGIGRIIGAVSLVHWRTKQRRSDDGVI